MSKAKLTIENTELEKFKSCAQLAGMKVLEVQNLGSLNQVVTYYKTEQQLLMCGRYMEKIKESEGEREIVVDTPVRKGVTRPRQSKKKIKS